MGIYISIKEKIRKKMSRSYAVMYVSGNNTWFGGSYTSKKNAITMSKAMSDKMIDPGTGRSYQYIAVVRLSDIVWEA